MIASASKRSIVDRMLGAALLESDIYEEAAMAPSLKLQAALVVAFSAIAAALAGLGAGLLGFVFSGFIAVVGWGVYAGACYWTATARFGVPRSPTTLGSTLRVLGFASSPRIFLVLTFLPTIGILVGLAVHAWVLITTVLAVKSALDLDTRPAIITAMSGLAPMLLLWAIAAVLV